MVCGLTSRSRRTATPPLNSSVSLKMKMKRIVAAILLIAPAVCVAQSGCATSPKPVASCWVAHGRLSVYNGAWSAVIWPVGTKRLLAVGGPEDRPYMPASLRTKLMSGDAENEIYGNFNVCPLSAARIGEVQFVCVQSAEQLVVKTKHAGG